MDNKVNSDNRIFEDNSQLMNENDIHEKGQNDLYILIKGL